MSSQEASDSTYSLCRVTTRVLAETEVLLVCDIVCAELCGVTFRLAWLLREQSLNQLGCLFANVGQVAV